jgi:hypothetical protein
MTFCPCHCSFRACRDSSTVEPTAKVTFSQLAALISQAAASGTHRIGEAQKQHAAAHPAAWVRGSRVLRGIEFA